MSEFFNVTLNKDIVLDDSQTSDSSCWSSSKTVQEIVENRITEFQSLSDVDVINKKDKQIIAYSEATGKFTTIDPTNIGGGSGSTVINQINRLGVVGTSTAPSTIDIPVNTVDFKVPTVNVLKFQTGQQNVIKSLNGFSASENIENVNDNMVVFDGTIRLKTQHDYNLTYDSDSTSYTGYSCDVDLSQFKIFSSCLNTQSGTDELFRLNAVPNDRLFSKSVDYDLSNASNIDYFNITGTGANVKIIVSIDEGNTWKTFNVDHFENIPYAVSDVKSKGISISTFNAIGSSYWNTLITTKKIRFAILFCMDSISDVQNMDLLSVQYDGLGSWVQAKPTEFDVIYASNTLLQIKIYFSGDIKINY